MRIPKTSKLDAYRTLLFQLWKEGAIVADIRRILKKEGCKATDTTIAKWYSWRVTAGELLARDPVHGEPAKPLFKEARSLGILDPDGDEDRQVRTHRLLRILIEPEIAGNEDEVHRSLGPRGFDLPLDENGEPDFSRYARMIGKPRLLTLGDMDFILLAMWTKKYRAVMSKPQGFTINGMSSRRRELIRLARGVRDDMFGAIGRRSA